MTPFFISDWGKGRTPGWPGSPVVLMEGGDFTHGPLYAAIGGTRSRRVKVGQLFFHVVQDPHGVVLLAGLNSVATADFRGHTAVCVTKQGYLGAVATN